MTVRVRLFKPSDRDFITALVTRLSECDLPAWRQADQVDLTNIAMVNQAMDELDPADAIFVAEDEAAGQLLGFVRLQTQTDYFSREKHGYISNIAVERSVESQGIGHMLLETAENWARDRGFSLITLHVFASNHHAKQIYEKLGYQQDVLSYAKLLAPDE
jgi:ribosomal protein S18 acetylase RimI-like enzyme